TQQDLCDIAGPYLVELYELTHETVHLATLDAGQVLYLEKVHGHAPSMTLSRVGGRMPPHCTALGKAMLAHADAATLGGVLRTPWRRYTPYTITLPGMLLKELAVVREQGVAFDLEESKLGMACVGAPVLDS